MFEGEGAEKRVGKVGGDACLARTGVDGGSGMTGAERLAFFLGDFLLITGLLTSSSVSLS